VLHSNISSNVVDTVPFRFDQLDFLVLTGDVSKDEGMRVDAHRDQAVHVQTMSVHRAEQHILFGDIVETRRNVLPPSDERPEVMIYLVELGETAEPLDGPVGLPWAGWHCIVISAVSSAGSGVATANR
jgi:hypothetical protein